MRILAVLMASVSVAASTVTEHVAMGPSQGVQTLNFATVTYPEDHGAASVNDVTITDADKNLGVLGAWQDLELESHLKCTGKMKDDRYFAMHNLGRAPETGDGCCADTLRVYGKDDGGKFSDIRIDDIISPVFAEDSISYAYASHTFHVTEIEDKTVALFVVQYKEPELGDALADAVVAVDVDTSTLFTTKNGAKSFSYYRDLGTTSQTATDSIYEVYHSVAKGEFRNYLKSRTNEQLVHDVRNNKTLASEVEEYHMNGIEHFTVLDGTAILGSTHRSANTEARLVKCPFTYSSEQGGGALLQRFGSPGVHTFGLKSGSPSFLAMHNIYYTNYSDGSETLTVFVNEQTGEKNSQVFEFGLNLVPQSNSPGLDDTVFETTYQNVELSFSTGSQGGARPIGEGVYLVSTGSAEIGMEVYDSKGGQTTLTHDAAIYDPFTFVQA